MNWQHLDSMGGEIISLAELMIAGNGSNCQQRNIGAQKKKSGTRRKMGPEKKKWDPRRKNGTQEEKRKEKMGLESEVVDIFHILL